MSCLFNAFVCGVTSTAAVVALYGGEVLSPVINIVLAVVNGFFAVRGFRNEVAK